MPWFRFYQQWLSRTFHGAVGVAMTAVGVITLIAVALYDRIELERDIRIGWQAGLVIFVAVILGRFLLAPYWIYREQDLELRRLRDQLDGRWRVMAFKALLGGAGRRGRELRGEVRVSLIYSPSSVPEVRGWAAETRQLIRSAVGDGEASIFMRDTDEVSHTSESSMKHLIDIGLRQIDELIQRADTLTLVPDFDPDEFGDGGE